jgi:mRNA interferase MazF
MPFAPGDVLVMPFPYSDRLAEKRRPALVVSTPDLERDYGLVWTAMITSAKGAQRQGDIAIGNLASAGLGAASVIRPTKIATVEPHRVVRVAGKVTGADLDLALAAVAAFVAS